MSARWNIAALQVPVSAELPCGANLEDADDLRALEAYQIFGQDTLEPEVRPKGEPVPKEARKGKAERPPNWPELGDLAYLTLSKSKDLRVLTHLAAAVLRVDGPKAFIDTVTTASKWLSEYWKNVFPLVDEDAIFRRNALNQFADRMAIVDGFRRAPLVVSRQHGKLSLKDMEPAATPSADGADIAPIDAQISAAFGEMPFDELQALHASSSEGLAALGSMEEIARRESGLDGTPTFDPLVAEFRKLEAILRERVARHPANPAAADGAAAGAGAGAEGGAVAVGAIRSRQDAIRALEAVAEFFRKNEPSSPLPLIVDRAKRLVAKDFLEVLADVAPDALAQARAATGIKD